jgi:predicted TIM-barrel fold metal-dependent hydrolase
MHVYAKAEELGMPILFHPVGQFIEASKLEFARPYLLDEVARSFPKLRLVIAQMGQPWIDETILMLGKHAMSSPTCPACWRARGRRTTRWCRPISMA